MRRLLSLFLLSALVLVPTLTACSSSEVSQETTAADETETTAAETEPVEYEQMSLLERLKLDYNAVPDDLPEEDYEGYTFRIQQPARGIPVLTDVDNSADIVGDALYRREMAVEERFNVNLELMLTDNSNYAVNFNQMNAIFLAQEDAYDLTIIWNTMAGPFAREGFLADLSTIDSIDFSKPWFYAAATNMLSYQGHKYVSVDLVLPIFSDLSCIFFNKTLAEKYQLEDLYQVVRENRFTFEYLKGVTADVWEDVNGNNAVDSDTDIFGLSVGIAPFSYNALPAFGASVIGKDDKDTPYLYPSVNMERADAVYSGFRTFFHESQGVTYSDWEIVPFMEGRSLFAVGSVGNTSELRSVDFEYGILPLCKWDEAQTTYQSCFLPMPTAIPATVTDMSRSGVIMSALAAGGYKEVAPAYYETALKAKFAMDEGSAEMLDIIASNAVADGTIMFTDSLIYTFLDYMKDSKEFASFWAVKEKSAQKYLDQIAAEFDRLIAG